MPATTDNQRSNPVGVRADVAEFIIDRQSRNLSPKTIAWYQDSLTRFALFLDDSQIVTTEAITPATLRRFLVTLQQSHNPGGVLRIYGAVRTFLRWFEIELAPEGWESPTHKVKPPKRPQEILAPLSMEHFTAMLDQCRTRTLIGDRDRALLLVLLDSGLRQNEVTALECSDIDIDTGQVTVRQGKGAKDRIAFIGHRTRRALVAYLSHRPHTNPNDPLWVTSQDKRLSRSGIRQIVRRRAHEAGIKEPGMHAFRRAFAVNFIRSGGSLATLQRLLGHSNISVTIRYLKLDTEDLRNAYKNASPVDNFLG